MLLRLVVAVGVHYKCFLRRFWFVLLLFGALIYLCLMDFWLYQMITLPILPLGVNDSSLGCRLDYMQEPGNTDDNRWRAEYESRVQRVRDSCDKDKNVFFMSRFSSSLTNHLNGETSQCPASICPIISKEQQMLFCFIPKVASTNVKRLLPNISNIPINDVLKNNTAMHVAADDALRHINPMYYRTSMSQFDDFLNKIVFVRHPFDRLVSAFRSKAERSRDEVPYFYNRYWDPIMKDLRPSGSTPDRITFKEFVWYLTHTDKREYDEHWAPFWSRCYPYLVNYDFIGKLETSEHDFLHAFREAKIEFSPEWWIGYEPTRHAVTLEYFATIPEDMIRSLYEIYKLDFELFGYSVKEFLPGDFFEK